MVEVEIGVWSKIDPGVLAIGVDDVTEKSAEDSSRLSVAQRIRGRMRWHRVLLDILGVILWSYVFVKLFIFDVERVVLERLAPSTLPLLNYRFFFILALAIVLSIFFRKKRLQAVYLLLFPLVVLLWRVPNSIRKAKSWIVVLGVMNLVASFFRDFRFNFVVRSFVAFSILGIVVSDAVAVIIPSAAVIAGFLLVAIYRTVKFSLTPSRFLSMQKSLIKRASDSRVIVHLTSISEDLRRSEVEKFDKDQLGTFRSNLSLALLANKSVYYWAYQLDRYRKSPVTLIFGSISYLGLYLQAIAVFSFLNLAVLKLAPHEFRFAEYPSFLQILHYSLFVGSGSALDPEGSWALAIKIAANILGPTLLAALVIQFAIARRQLQEDVAITETVSAMKDTGAEIRSRLEAEYGVTVEEAFSRLAKFGDNFILQAVIFLADRVPDEFERKN